ncbi:MAG: alpha/beta-type small acid-soluble spore protein [Clostridiaceae bacterium]|nr:alpha/beta-type small acid-soluble spore protein [Clostridiaceae bacterium]MBW4859125.1 alpha/beta-type small acid-soluble spore protein [Clostridiaceae bacterium]MBW4867881.1 alpha/beta-type small acid-soluble spore protein [Clostridiaceae bacterium]MBW4867928.1 alpha/beta-type small acid-soluble spore protein [Clostridiaceae bacterium]
MSKKKKKIETLEDKLKYEIAEELGLMEKIKEVGWGGLTAKESGRIGGLITVKKREMAKKEALKDKE